MNCNDWRLLAGIDLSAWQSMVCSTSFKEEFTHLLQLKMNKEVCTRNRRFFTIVHAVGLKERLQLRGCDAEGNQEEVQLGQETAVLTISFIVLTVKTACLKPFLVTCYIPFNAVSRH